MESSCRVMDSCPARPIWKTSSLRKSGTGIRSEQWFYA
jgi:hypothetical protein